MQTRLVTTCMSCDGVLTLIYDQDEDNKWLEEVWKEGCVCVKPDPAEYELHASMNNYQVYLGRPL
jgi:hypothetical protein